MNLIRAGAATPRVPIYKSESYKLHQAFEPAADQTILPGYAVGLDATGKIFPWKGIGTYLGIATTKTNAYGEITVMVQGYAIIHGVSAGELTAGFVKPGDPYTGKTDYLSYSQSTQVVGADTVALPSDFILLTPATAAGQVVPILVK